MMDPTTDTTPAAASDPEPDRDDSAPEDEVEELAEAYDLEENGRKWLRAITGLLERHTDDSATDRRVQFSIDMMTIAACERATRILHSDLSEE